jgi:hypothetical protein
VPSSVRPMYVAKLHGLQKRSIEYEVSSIEPGHISNVLSELELEMRIFAVSAEDPSVSSHTTTARTRVIFDAQHVQHIQGSMLAVAIANSSVQDDANVPDDTNLPMTTNFSLHRSFQRLIRGMLGRQYVQQTGAVVCFALTHPLLPLSFRSNQLSVAEAWNAHFTPGAEGFKDNRLSLEDWNINNQSVALLTPLANASQYLEGKNYTTSNLVIPSMYGCIELLHPNAAVRQPWDGKLLKPKDLRPEVTEGRQVLYDDMVRRWKTEISTELKHFYFIATICDPRQQGLTFPGVSQEERLEAHEWFEAEYDSLWNTSAPEEPSVPALAPAASASLPVPALAPAASASASLGSFVDFMASVAHLQAPVPAQVSRVKSEAHRYLELPAAPMNTDPLEWWAANEINFPALSVMARQYLGVPATSASAERLFSLAGRAFDDLRQRMKEEMLEILMWARINKEKRQRD